MIRSLLSTPAPTVAVELSSTAVAAVAATPRGSGWIVSTHATEPLPTGAVVPALNTRNVHDQAVAAAALQRVFQTLDVRPSRIALLVPDPVAKVSLIRFDNVPARTDDLDQLIRFRVRKSAPFRVEDAQMTYARGARLPEGGQEYVVALARRDVITEYEALSAAAGAHAGIVDLASFNVINAVLASTPPGGDWLLVHIRPDYSSVAILRGGHLLFFRNRSGDGEGSLADLVHQTAMYYEDRLGGEGIERVILTGAHSAARDAAGPSGINPETLRRQLEERTRTQVDMLDPTRLMPLATRIVASPELHDRIAPLIGVLSRAHAT
ncbi:MAG: pilus assembly protein PilM [Acidobacteria bacterium]|nr:pilus assembly protein PilM [Acidobacteriota bacterium]